MREKITQNYHENDNKKVKNDHENDPDLGHIFHFIIDQLASSSINPILI